MSGDGGGPSSWHGGQTWRAVSRREYGLIYVLKGAARVRVWRLGCRTSKTDWVAVTGKGWWQLAPGGGTKRGRQIQDGDRAGSDLNWWQRNVGGEAFQQRGS